MKGSERAIINHPGTVSDNTGSSLFVTISTSSACSGCHAKSSCNMFGSENRIVEVKGNYDFKTGQSVNVLMEQSMGYTALLYGYLLPFVILLSTLIIMIAAGFSELTAGVSSLVILAPYYMMVYFFRKRINEKFIFKIKA
ncbi:MAG TPA: SoxR reducing system RseC family protein [Bacteroidales bacterium]|nr:SoxR reducing system RseC family protein [Bacteroidales bacterium]